MSEFRTGVETRDLASGWQGILHHGDGTATKVWGPTEAQARGKAQEAASRD